MLSVPRSSEVHAACIILTEGVFPSLFHLFKEEIYAYVSVKLES